MNPLKNNINHGLPPQLTQSINQIKSVMGLAKGNPNQIFEQLSKQNPQFGQILQMCQTNSKGAEQLFYSMCAERGIDAQAVLKQLQNTME